MINARRCKNCNLWVRLEKPKTRHEKYIGECWCIEFRKTIRKCPKDGVVIRGMKDRPLTGSDFVCIHHIDEIGGSPKKVRKVKD